MKEELREQIVSYLLENQDKFYRLAFSYVHNADAALDIVQNAIVKALEHYTSIRNADYVKTWFYRVLVNECLTALQKGNGNIPMSQRICSAFKIRRWRKTTRRWKFMNRCKSSRKR